MMVIISGIAGFFIGFMIGQLVLSKLLAGKSRDELLSDKSLRLKYGLINWGFALIGAYGAIELYQHFLRRKSALYIFCTKFIS